MTHSTAGASRARANRLRKSGPRAQLLRPPTRKAEPRPCSSRGSLLATAFSRRMRIALHSPVDEETRWLA
jgi:hypothetical protein